MTRKIFFSFHYERDAWRAGQVRNSDMIPNEDEVGFIDAVAWEEIKRQGYDAIKRWILDQLDGTSVTVVLIGAETSERPWVDFEIRESWKRGNAIIGLYIHNVKDQDRKTDIQGINPFDNIYLVNGQPLSNVCKTYDWVLNDGRNNLGKWADQSFKDRNDYTGETKLKDALTKGLLPNSSPLNTPSLVNPVSNKTNSGFIPHSPHCDDANR